MTKREEAVLREFFQAAKRIGMYCPPNKDGIVGFVHGVELGAGGNLIVAHIERLLMRKYRFKRDALGWPGLIEKFSVKKQIPWGEGFVEVICEIEKASVRDGDRNPTV